MRPVIQLLRHIGKRNEMEYTIRELDTFSVIGQEVELTNYQKRNIQISTQFWRKFNSNLKKAYLSQLRNWVKYAFMEKRNGKLFFFALFPKEMSFQTVLSTKRYNHVNIL